MTTRDRMVLIAVVVLVVLAGGWVLAVSPERKQAGKRAGAGTERPPAAGNRQSRRPRARVPRSVYNAAYSSVVSLGKAVPPSEEVPSLIYQLELASDQRDMNSTRSPRRPTPAAQEARPPCGTAAAAMRRPPVALRRCRSRSSSRAASRGWRTCSGRSKASRSATPPVSSPVSGRLLTIQGAEHHRPETPAAKAIRAPAPPSARLRGR